MVRLLRVTRHRLLPEMVAELDRRFGAGNYAVTEYRDTVTAARLRALAAMGRWDWVEVVLPPAMTQLALRLWPGRVVRSVHRREVLPSGKTVYRFTGYVQVEEVRMRTRKWAVQPTGCVPRRGSCPERRKPC